MPGLGSTFTLAVTIAAVDHYTGTLRRIAEQTGSVSKATEAMQKKMANFKAMAFTGGAISLAGAALAKSIESGVNQAGEFLTKMTMIQDTVGATADQMSKIQQVIRQSSGSTIFGIDQTSNMAVKLASSGLSAQQIKQTLPIFTQYAEVQKLGKGTDPIEAITQAISAAHIVGAYKPSQLMPFLNNFNKATFMQPGTSSEFADTFKYLAPNMQALHASTNDILTTAALANRVGFIGSMGGTNAADMIIRSIPGLFGGRGKTPSAQMRALQQLGLDKTVFGKNGNFLGITNFVEQLQKVSAGKNPMELTRMYHSIFGTQGMKIADVLSSKQGQEALQAIVKQMSSMKSISQMQEDTNKTPAGQIMQMQTNLQNLKLDVFLQMAKVLNPVFHYLNGIVSKVQDFTDKHPQIAKIVSDFGLAATAVALIVGPLMAVVGALGYLKSSSALQAGFGLLSKSFTGMLGPLALVGGAAYLLYEAWTHNFGGIQQKTKAVFDWIKAEIPQVMTKIHQFLQLVGVENKSSGKIQGPQLPKHGQKSPIYGPQLPLNGPKFPLQGPKLPLKDQSATHQVPSPGEISKYKIPSWAKWAAGALVGRKALDVVGGHAKVMSGHMGSILKSTGEVYKYQRALGGSKLGSLFQTGKFFGKQGMLSALKGAGKLTEGAARMVFGDIPVDVAKKVGGWGLKLGGHVAKGIRHHGGNAITKGFGALKRLHQSQAISYYASQGFDAAKTFGKHIGSGAKAVGKWAATSTVSGITKLGSAMKTLGSNVASAALSFGKLGLKVGIATAKFIANAAATVAVKVAQTAASLATKIWSGIMVIFDAVMDANPISLIIIAIAALIGVIILVVTHWKQVKQVIGEVWDKMKAFGADIANVFTKLWHDAVDWGKNIVHGIWNGISGMWNWLKTHVTQWIKDVVPGPIANALGIHSPSRLMMEHGKYIAQGLALGMTNNANLVDSASKQLAKASVIDTMGRVGGNSVNSSSQTINIHPGAIQINGAGRQADDIIDEMFDRLGIHTRQSNMSRSMAPNRLLFR